MEWLGKSRSHEVAVSLIAAAVFSACFMQSANAEGRGRATIPLIYCTDLFHPPDDPDDWFDLATVFSMEEFDIRGIVLDQGGKQLQKPGRIPVEQMMAITGRKVACACGLPEKLKSRSDKALDQPEAFQAGVKLILQLLRKSDRKVTLITVGSLRDVCAAFNREPQLLKAKVAGVYVVAGHSDGGEEYNVRLDPHAYVGVMRSSLPIYWLPCFGKQPYVSRWDFKQGDVLENCPLPVQNFFVYGLMKTDPKKADAILALYKPIPEEVKNKLWPMQRPMWSTPAFLHAAGRTTKARDAPQTSPGGTGRAPSRVFTFVPVRVRVRDDGTVRGEDMDFASPERNMRVFRFEESLDPYEDAMTRTLGNLLRDLSP